MKSRSGLSKLKAILLVDVIIVASIAGVYLYFQGQGGFAAGPAIFELSDLKVNPIEADLGEPIVIGVNVTNIGETEGAYVANLTINNQFRENQTVAVLPSETKTIAFVVTETVEGNYSVRIGDLYSSYLIKAAPPEASSIVLSDLAIAPREAWVGYPINVTVAAHNNGAEADTLSVKLYIDDKFSEAKIIALEANGGTQVEFIFNMTVEGAHKLKVNTIYGSFKVVPVGTHTLTIYTTPTPDEGYAEFTINGQKQRTPYAEVLPEGQYSISMPATDPTGLHAFLYWENGLTSPSRTITLDKPTILVGYYEKGDSCPSLFIWNGTGNSYISEVSNHGWLGYINYMNADGSIVFYRNNPWDYIPIDRKLLQAEEGSYIATLAQMWDEIFYLDSAYMVVVDHPSNTEVYSTMVEQYLDPDFMGKIYTVSTNRLTPVSAFNEKGQNVLPQISKIDNVFTPGINGIQSPSWDDIQWNRLTLDLGDQSGAKEIKLVVKAVVDWGEGSDYNTWLDQFFDAAYSGQLTDGTQVTPPPYMEVIAQNGSWISVPWGRQFPLPSSGVARTFVVDLTGLFPTQDYHIRINNFWNVTFDYIGIDISVQQNVVVQKIDPQASLIQWFTTNSNSVGNFTRYGDVTEIVLSSDDEFVIGRQGDAVQLNFPISNLPKPAPEIIRDYFFFVNCWFKDEYGNWGFGFGFSTDPLPFQNMTGFPYNPPEDYPRELHQDYLSEYNTREIEPP
ncbi:TPA: hypothetical protein HA274_01910 [Candidatus Bathyarchaeota archaeon]|nr:hypothetical protein [Candidatus Bathyarchaeota archaeon]